MNSEGNLKPLLDRPAPEGYLEDWQQILKEERSNSQKKSYTSVLVFRLHDEWLGIPTEAIKEIVNVKTIHSIPHKTNPIIQGTVNLRGQLKLVVSLENVLEIKNESDDSSIQTPSYKRMIVLKQDSEYWVTRVHDVEGVVHVDLDTMNNVPVTVSKSTANYLKGVYELEGKSIGILEEELIFFKLRRSIS